MMNDFDYQGVFVTLADSNFPQLVEFYQDLFACKPTVFLPLRYGEFNLKGLRLGIFCPKVSQKGEFEHSECSGMSFCVVVEDLLAVMAYVEVKGCRRSSVMRSSHGEEFYTYDPAGNRIIFYQPLV